jgi:TonB family protein
MSASLTHAKPKTVLVFDFVGPDRMDPIGQTLAADFRVSMARSGQDVRVQDYSELLGMLKKNGLVLANLHDVATASRLVRQTEVDAWIYGKLSNSVGGLKLTVDAYPLSPFVERYFEFENSIPRSDDLKPLIVERVKDEFSALPRPGQRGYSYPECIDCPVLPSSEEVLRCKFSGTVVLEVTVEPDGHTKDIRVKVGLPFGLTQQAVDTVKEWRLKPAIGPDGKPAAIRQVVELSLSCS